MVAPSPIMKPPPATTGMGEKAAPDVMGAMKRQRGAGPTPPSANMTPVQIVQDVMQKQGEDPQTATEFLRNLDRLAQGNLATFVQLGNTLFIMLKMDERGQRLPEGAVQMIPFTAEEDAIVQRLQVLPNTLKQLGIQRVFMKTDDPDDLTAMQQAGLRPKVRQEVAYTGQAMAPMYSVELEV